MARLIGVIVLGLLLYQGYRHGLPWLEARFGGAGIEAASGEREEALRCVDLARRASRSLGDTIRQFAHPPINQQEWTSAFISVSADIGSAESACICPGDACDRASAAVSELRDLSLSFDGVARGAARGMGNPARLLERAQELLDEAERLTGR